MGCRQKCHKLQEIYEMHAHIYGEGGTIEWTGCLNMVHWIQKVSRQVSGYHVDTLSLAKADGKVKAVWPSH